MKPTSLFIDRKKELDYLERVYNKEGKQLIILYGRRRIGKTELITHFSSDKTSIYFLADKRGTVKNAERFAEICAVHFDDVRPDVKGFDDVFTYIKNRVKKEKIIVIIDEFSYLVEKDESIPSVFQLIFDEILKETNILLILAGSSVSMMYRGALSYESPLYGRRSGDWMLKAMSFQQIKKFYPKLSIEEMIKTYAIVGGIPAYATHFQSNGINGIFESIKFNILTKGEYLYNEPEVLLKEELRDPSSYFSILEAMTSSAKLTDIANAARIPAKDMPKYLKILEDLEIVYKITPITEKKSKKSLYFIKDNFFSFWFKFIYPKKSELESGQIESVLSLIKRDFNTYVGKVFEQVCKEYVEQKKIVPFSKIGKWWGYSRDKKMNERIMEEIDIVSIDENTGNILFGECKWQENVNAVDLTIELAEKASFVDWKKDSRKPTLVIFAKSFSKRIIQTENSVLVYCFDLKDLYEYL
ncbi:MAG: ATP-binding protein [Candidatus Micrarchaeota archaeon]